MKKVCIIVVGLILLTAVDSFAALFSDNFESGNLNNWVCDGTWTNTTLNDATHCARGLYSDNDGSMTHTFSSYITGNWTVTFNYDFEWGGSVDSGDPRLTLAAAMVDDSNNGYCVVLREGSWGDSITYPSVMIYQVTDGTIGDTALVTGEGYDIGGWKGIYGQDSVPHWKGVEFSWEESTGSLSVIVNGTTVTATDLAYTEFTKISFVGHVLGSEGIDIDDVTVVPEPMTVCMLLVGGALLKRKQ